MSLRLKRKKTHIGRSIEEIIVLRQINKVDGADPQTWPELKPSNIFSPQPFYLLETSKPNSTVVPLVQSTSLSVTQPQTNISSESFESVKQQNDSDILLSAMKNYCKALEHRVKELENQLKSTANIMKRELAKSQQFVVDARKLASHPLDTDKDISTVASLVHEGFAPNPVADKSILLREDLKDSLSRIDVKVLGLRELFRNGDPFTVRNHASTLIVAAVRGFLARRRYHRYRKGIQEWKWSRSKVVVYVLDHWLAQQTKLDVGVRKMILLRDLKAMLTVLHKWAYISKQHAPIRHKIRETAEEWFTEKRLRFMRRAFDAFREGCIGQQSRRAAKEERKVLVEMVRRELRVKHEQTGDTLGVITDEEVKQLTYRYIVTSFLKKKENELKNKIFQLLCRNVKRAKQLVGRAKYHWLKRSAGRCFYSWSDYVYQVSQGLERKRWPGPRRYEVRYNQKRVDYFTRVRLIRYAFIPLRKHIMQVIAVKRAYQRNAGKLLKRIIDAWKVTAHRDRIIRHQALQRWQTYSTVLTSVPFKAWKEYVNRLRRRSLEHNIMVDAYLRWKGRQKMYLIMRTWRHQALYGRVDGMYSRQMLVKSLQEQKLHCNALTKMMAKQSMELEECRGLVQNETKKKEEIEEKLRTCYLECGRLKSLTHHAQQEYLRMKAIVQSVALINPKQVQHLNKLQPNFQFRERKITTRVKLDEGFVADSTDVLDSGSVNGEAAEMGEPLPGPIATMTTHEGQSVGDIGIESIDAPNLSAGVDQQGAFITKEEKVLLDRIKWFLSQFAETINYSAPLADESVGGQDRRGSATGRRTSIGGRGSNEHSRLNSNQSRRPSINVPHPGPSGSLTFLQEQLNELEQNRMELIRFPTNQENAIVKLFHPTHYHNGAPAPVIKVKIREMSGATISGDNVSMDEQNKSSAFATAVAAATAAATAMISQHTASHQALAASDFLGAGSEFVAAKMLLGIIDFLQSAEDRSAWTEYLFKHSLAQDAPPPVDDSTEPGGHAPVPTNQLRDTTIVAEIVRNMKASNAKSADAAERGASPQPLWNNNIEDASNSILANNFTWRAALTALRALHPAPSTYHSLNSIEQQQLRELDDLANLARDKTQAITSTDNGSDDPISPSTDRPDKNIPLRLLQMKEHLTLVMQSQERKYQQRVEALTQTRGGDLTSSADNQLASKERDTLLAEYVKTLLNRPVEVGTEQSASNIDPPLSDSDDEKTTRRKKSLARDNASKSTDDDSESSSVKVNASKRKKRNN